jgi:archaellum component FlaG (FlaF/FlaG flagellin family)
VYNPTAITYEAGKNVDFYLSKTGNPTVNADTDGIYVIKSDGSVLTDHNFRTGWGPWSQGVRGATLEPGDTVMVPEKVAQDSAIRDVKDITQILFQIATTAGITWGMIKR